MATETLKAVDHKLLAAGEWVETGAWAEVRSPYDGTVVGRVAEGDSALVDRVARAAQQAFEAGDFPRHERAAVLDRAAALAAGRIDELALTIAAEAGKPLKTARVEAARCADTLTFSAVEARKLSGSTVPMDASTAGAGKLGLVLRVPFGVVGAISPFNFPLNLVAHKLGPALAGRQRGRPQAGRADADLGPEAGRDPGRGGAAAGLAQRRPGPRLGGRQRDRRARADQGAQLHRLRQGRLGHPRPRPPQEGQPGAGLERAADRPRRRRLGGGRRQSQAARLLPRRAELHLDPARARPRGGRRRLHGATGRQRRGAAGRRPARPRDRRRPADHAREPRPGQAVGRRGGGRRRRAPLAAASWSTRGAAWRRPCSARRRARRRSGARRSSARSRRSTATPTSARRCGSPTTPASASRPASSPATSAAPWRRRGRWSSAAC